MERVIRYRPGWRQLPWFNVIPLAIPTVNVLSGRLSRWWLLPLVIVVAGTHAYYRQLGVELRPDALVVYGIQVRRVPWQHVTWVGADRLLGERGVGIRTRNDYFRLRAPTHHFLAPDPDFAAKAGTIHEYWIRHRGSEWRPPPATWPWPTASPT